jgi:hypothetical protein
LEGKIMKFTSLALVAALGLSTASCAAILPKEQVCTTVTDKDRITNRSSDGGTSSKYLIFTQAETFENTDDLSVMKFNSSDVYGGLTVGQAYCFTVAGYRVPFLSMYRNIISFHQAPNN